jgi:biopolymer transport protein TolR
MSMPKRVRRMALHHLRRNQDVELNLIPLIDIMSVMVAFLLVYSADVEVIQNGKGVVIPQSIAQEKPKQSIVVMITKEHLFVQGELVTSIAEIRASDAPLVAPLSAVLARPMLASADGGAVVDDLADREITVMADKSLPYEVVKRVMSTCTNEGYGRISLAVMEKETPRELLSKL